MLWALKVFTRYLVNHTRYVINYFTVLSNIWVVVSEFRNFNWILAKYDIECFSTGKILTIGWLSLVTMFFFYSPLFYTHKFNSGKNLLTILIDTKEITLNMRSTHRKHNVKKYPFHNILSQHWFQDNLKIFN